MVQQRDLKSHYDRTPMSRKNKRANLLHADQMEKIVFSRALHTVLCIIGIKTESIHMWAPKFRVIEATVVFFIAYVRGFHQIIKHGVYNHWWMEFLAQRKPSHGHLPRPAHTLLFLHAPLACTKIPSLLQLNVSQTINVYKRRIKHKRKWNIWEEASNPAGFLGWNDSMTTKKWRDSECSGWNENHW